MKKSKLIVTTISALLLLFTFSVSAFAADYYTFNNHRIIAGINSQKYYMSSSCTNEISNITSAIDSWNSTSTYFWFSSYYLSSGTKIDFYKSNFYDPSTGYIAETLFYQGGYIEPDTSNWTFTEIDINSPVYDNLTQSGKRGTLCHEIGHATGLAHNNGNTGSIMCQTSFGRTVQTPQTCDCNGVNFLYPTRGGI